MRSTVDIMSSGGGLRYHPVNFAIKVLMAYGLGADLTLHALAFSAFGFVSSLALYFALRFARVSWHLAALFPILFLFGASSEAYLQFGYGEPFGVFFFSLALLLATLGFRIRSWGWYVLSAGGCLLMLVLMALCKESFLVFLPGFLALYLYLAHEVRGMCSEPACCPGGRRLPMLLFCAAGMVVFAFFLLKVVGAMESGESYFWTSMIDALSLFLHRLQDLLQKKDAYILLVVLLVWFLSAWVRNKSLRSALKQMFVVTWPIAVVMAFILLPQVVLHLSLGFTSGRYRIPGVLATSFFAVWVSQKSSRQFPRLYFPWVLLLAVYAAGMCLTTYGMAREFSRSRKDNAGFLDVVAAYGGEGGRVVFVVPGEAGELDVALTARDYLRHHHHIDGITIVATAWRDNLWLSPVHPDRIPYIISPSLDMELSPGERVVFVIFKPLENRFLDANQDWITRSTWTRMAIHIPTTSWLNPVILYSGDVDASPGERPRPE